MSEQAVQTKGDRLTLTERIIAGAAGAALLATALSLVAVPPDHRVALPQCPRASSGCILSVDNDLTPLAAILAALGAAAALIAILGIRFNTVKAGGAELGRVDTEGLAYAPLAEEGTADTGRGETLPDQQVAEQPISVEVRRGLGTTLGVAPVAVAHLIEPMSSVEPLILRDYRSARKKCQHEHFLTHTLNPAKTPGQAYSVALRVTPVKGTTEKVRSASFFFGKFWGDRVFAGQRGADGRFGIVTEAYGPFLALCEVEFESGRRILLDHYCDFDMAELLRP
ncbi:pYEATS domain-containing protein [Streptomyces sp. NPDC002795]|uniref:pYEATS domain-containing protein n=1 Tax=Streptomyces sp. NPDC002795 TaxID=3364665 RepID=UPI003690DE24